MELRLPFDRLEDGRQIKILPVVDNYTRECLAILVAFNITAKDVVALLERLVAEHGAPSFMRSDNGPEFIARAVKGWLENSGIVTDYIEPGSPWENSYSESFNSRFRDELLNAEILTTLLEARVLIEEHRQHYNRDRVHSSLGYRTPIEFAAQLNEEGVRKASAKGKSKTDGGRPRGGQGIVWYTGQFYALSFLQSVMKIDIVKSSTIVAIAILFGMPFFTVFGALSDKIGRLKIMMAGNLIAALTYLPIYHAMVKAGADPKNPNMVMLTLLVFIQVIYVTMVYGPIAAFLIEAFPARIRYTSFSLPYHIGNGWFGGTLPLIAGVLVAETHNIYAGLYWVMAVALMTFIVWTFALNESHRTEIWKEAEAARPAA